MFKFKIKTKLKKYAELNGFICNAHTQHSALVHARFVFNQKWEMYELDYAFKRRWISISIIGSSDENAKR